MSQDTFKRFEKKYMLNAEQYEEFSRKIADRTKADEFGKYTICNIYFDTDDFQLVRTSIEKPKYKEKLRLRSYGTPTADSSVFLEIKKKYKDVVYKRRICLPYGECIDYITRGIKPRENTQIFREIDYFLDFYKPKMKMYLAYDRIALAGIEDPELRITFDTNIRTRTSYLDMTTGDSGKPLLDGEYYLMEVKAKGAIPIWLVEILSEMRVYPTSFSKYGTAYKKLLLEKIAKKNEEKKLQPTMEAQRDYTPFPEMQEKAMA